jgi:hypothetical protein
LGENGAFIPLANPEKSAAFLVGHTSVDGKRKKVQIFLEIFNEE